MARPVLRKEVDGNRRVIERTPQEDRTLPMKKLGATQRRVVELLSCNLSQQPTAQDIASLLGSSASQVKCALARLMERGIVLRTKTRPAHYGLAPKEE